LKGRIANSIKEITALLHRSYPLTRRALTDISNALRKAFGIRTEFEQGQSAGVVRMEYAFDPERRKVDISMDASGVRGNSLAELIVMNEQGAGFFTEYSDSDGVRLHDSAIGTWSPVTAETASFLDPRHGVSFSLRRIRGARLYRGRELVPDRLAWAGFAYVIPAGTPSFRCSVSMGEQP
jgi:hypothetical protein